jgi:hypothetical protein
MGIIIEDGKGSGKKAGIDNDNRLLARTFSESIQHSISHNEGQAYQVIGTTTLSNGTVVPLHITNDSSTLDLIITYCRHQIIDSSGGTSFPNINNYYSIALGRTYSSGGTTTIPINLNTTSGNAAEVTVYTDNPTLTGTESEIDRWHTKANGDMNTFNKEGSIVIGQNGTLELSYIGNQTSGTIYTRLSFLMMAKH